MSKFPWRPTPAGVFNNENKGGPWGSPGGRGPNGGGSGGGGGSRGGQPGGQSGGQSGGGDDPWATPQNDEPPF